MSAESLDKPLGPSASKFSSLIPIRTSPVLTPRACAREEVAKPRMCKCCESLRPNDFVCDWKVSS